MTLRRSSKSEFQYSALGLWNLVSLCDALWKNRPKDGRGRESFKRNHFSPGKIQSPSQKISPLEKRGRAVHFSQLGILFSSICLLNIYRCWVIPAMNLQFLSVSVSLTQNVENYYKLFFHSSVIKNFVSNF